MIIDIIVSDKHFYHMISLMQLVCFRKKL